MCTCHTLHTGIQIRYESLKSKFSLIPFVDKLMTGFEPDIIFSTKKTLQSTLSFFFSGEFIFNEGNQ